MGDMTMPLKQILEKSRQREPTIDDDISSLTDDDLMDFMNLNSARTGIDGTVFISTHMGSHGPRVKYFEKTGPGQPSFSVSIENEPKLLASSLPDRVVARKLPSVIAGTKLNREALQRFWNEGEYWGEDEVDSFKGGLRRVPWGT
jgi:hypothetical protein